jgi:hypothetical protein
MTELMVELSPFASGADALHTLSEPFPDPLDEPVALPVSRRWPTVLALGLIFGSAGYGVTKWVGLPLSRAPFASAPALSDDASETLVVARFFEPRFGASYPEPSMPKPSISDSLQRSAVAEPAPPEPRSAPPKAPPHKATPAPTPAPSVRKLGARRNPNADPALTSAEIARRKAAYERYLEENGLRRVEDLRVRVRPNGTSELLE